MDLDWEHYHWFNVSLLSAIGLWPYGNKLVLRLKRVVGGFFALLTCVAQLATFITVDYNKALLLQNVPCIFVGTGCLLKYISFLYASDCIKRVTEAINRDWKYLSTKEELGIIAQYIKRANFHTKGFAMLICPAGICLILLPLLLSLNGTRTFPIMFEFFLDQEKYFFLNAFVFDGAVVVTVITFVSTETLMFVYIQHTCSLFEVTSLRIKERLCSTGERDPKIGGNVVVIALVVEIHTRANRVWKIIREAFLPSYLMLIVFGVLSLGAHLFRCSQTLATHEFTEFLTSAFFCLAILGYMFYAIFMIQGILDTSLDIFHALCETNWYEFPVPARKLLLCCMLNTIKPAAVDVGSVFPGSYEGFSMLIRMTVSYATAMYSFR